MKKGSGIIFGLNLCVPSLCPIVIFLMRIKIRYNRVKKSNKTQHFVCRSTSQRHVFGSLSYHRGEQWFVPYHITCYCYGIVNVRSNDPESIINMYREFCLSFSYFMEFVLPFSSYFMMCGTHSWLGALCTFLAKCIKKWNII
jgi:hypothetical protein